MNTFLIILLVILMVLVVASLVRGIVAFLKSTKIDLESGEQTDATDMQLLQNKMMFARIKYQALAEAVEDSLTGQLARAATRRAERAMTAMAEQLRTNPQALAYLNRLSDYLFVLARTANDGGRSDIKWVPGANR